MVDVRGFNGGMDTDSAPELVKPGDYTYAMNVSVGAEGMTNILGNRVSGEFPESTIDGTEWICGAFLDRVRQRVIYFTNHSAGAHRIIAYNVPSISNQDGAYVVLFEDYNRIFNYWQISEKYNPECLIKDIKVIHREYEGDLYYFIDPKKKLLKFNYDKLSFLRAGIDNNLCAFGWTSANYDGTTLRDGTPIQQVTSSVDWASLTVPAWCYYDNNSSNNSTYGKLYNFYAVSHPLFAPSGYRVPTDTDWANLVTCLGGASVAGGKLKSTSDLWNAPNTGATNESLFNTIPAGQRFIDGGFTGLRLDSVLWSSTESDASDAWARGVSAISTSVARYKNPKHFGHSVRLIKEL